MTSGDSIVGERCSTQQGVKQNAYNGISDQIFVVTADGSALFFQGRTGTLYFYPEYVEGFVNAYGEASLGFWTTETPHVFRPGCTIPGTVDPSSY